MRIVRVAGPSIGGLSATGFGRSVAPWPIRDSVGAHGLLIPEIGLGGGEVDLAPSRRVRGETRSVSQGISLGAANPDRCLAPLRLGAQSHSPPQARGGPSLLQWRRGSPVY